jgi:hypothetical protein
MTKQLLYWLILTAVCLGWPLAAGASRPVPRTIEGCVIHGTLYSVRKDLAPARPGQGRVVAYPLRVANLDLTPYEGRRVRLSGHLLPGDRFTPDPKSLRVLGPCDRQSQEAIFRERR